MSEQVDLSAQPVTSWRLTLGVGMLLLSIITPLAGIPTVTSLDLSATMKSTLSGGLLIGKFEL